MNEYEYINEFVNNGFMLQKKAATQEIYFYVILQCCAMKLILRFLRNTMAVR